MAKKKKNDTFVGRHISAWVCALAVVILGVAINGIYGALISQAQMHAASNQLEDSTLNWVVHHQMSYGDLIPNTIVAITVFIVIAFLIPTIKHAYRLATNR